MLLQNAALFDELQQTKIKLKKLSDELNVISADNSSLKFENKLLSEKVERLQAKIENLDTAPNSYNTSINLDDGTHNAAKNLEKINDKFDLGSKTIGRIVVESAKAINALSSADEETLKTLSNMIVCKSELAKSEVLSICESDAPENTKNDMLESVVSDASDYFKSILAQI